MERHLPDYYGPHRSLLIWTEGWAGYPADAPLPAEALIVTDLTDWQYRPPRGHVAVDPVLGRLSFPTRQLPREGVWVRYHHGFSDDLGGGEYRRRLSQPSGATVYRVGHGEEFDRVTDALTRWRDESPRHAVIEITDGGVYTEQITVELGAGQSMQLRATDRTRPVLRLMDWHTARPDALSVRGERGSRFALDGLLVAGRGMQVDGPLAEVAIRHCTLVPGWAIGPDCEPHRPAEPSLELTDLRGHVTIERTILGSIQVSQDEVGADPVPIRLTDTILDATSENREAVGAPSWPLAHAVFTFQRCTVFGEIQTHAIDLAENSIFPAGSAWHAGNAAACGSVTSAGFPHAARVPLRASERAGPRSPARATAGPVTPSSAEHCSGGDPGAAPTTSRRWAPSTTCTSPSGRPTCGHASTSTYRPAMRRPASIFAS